MVYVYMVECRDGTLYTGWTTDLKQRVQAHNNGTGARYTRSRRPVRLVYWEPAADRSAALRREAALRRLPRDQKVALCESH
ncbi:MAG: GIY-YIG nuclease family protein [Anaerolineae bacterium]